MEEDLGQEEQRILDLLRSNESGMQSTHISAEIGLSNEDLMMTLNVLAERQLIEYLKQGNHLVIKAREAEEARKFGSMSDNERIVYQFIRDSGNKGTWLKHIKEKSGLHTKVVTDCLKHLERSKLIKQVKSVRSNKKVYLLFETEPSVELTGGSWYTDEEMDVEFIDQLSAQINKYIYAQTVSKNGIFPADKEYPTTGEIHDWISNSGITSQTLSEADIQSLLDRLVYDGEILKIDQGYSSISNVHRDNGWVESPCGQCSLFSFCHKDGPVNPNSCEYIKSWIQQ
jgi:DNA-directed RNA polymerase III subunit RPC6